MKLDDSNRRYSNIIAGILVISVASIILAYALGDWDHNVFSMNNPPQNGVELFMDKGNNIVENDILCELGFLSIPEKYCSDDLDTDAGEMVILSNLDETQTLPLSINEDMINSDWAMSIYSYGGYEFVEGVIEVYQNKFDDQGWWSCDLVGEIDIIYTTETVDLLTIDETLLNEIKGYFGMDLDEDFDELDITIGTLDLDGATIELDSNHIPDVLTEGWELDNVDHGFFFWDWFSDPPADLDKYVTLKYEMTWEGCWFDEQKFMVILAYSYMLLESLTPD